MSLIAQCLVVAGWLAAAWTRRQPASSKFNHGAAFGAHSHSGLHGAHAIGPALVKFSPSTRVCVLARPLPPRPPPTHIHIASALNTHERKELEAGSPRSLGAHGAALRPPSRPLSHEYDRGGRHSLSSGLQSRAEPPLPSPLPFFLSYEHTTVSLIRGRNRESKIPLQVRLARS